MQALIVLLSIVVSFHFTYAQQNLQSDKDQIAQMEQELEKKRAALKEKEKALSEATPTKRTDDHESNLRQRKYYLNADNLISLMIGDKFKSDSGTDRDRNRQLIDIDAGWNWGHIEAGPLLSYDKYDADSYKEDTLSLGGQVAYNFIPNQPGNDLVPFASLRLEQFSYDYNHSTNSRLNYSEKGLVYEIGGGVKYFPFGEYLALVARAYYRATDAKQDDVKYTIKGLRARGSLLIYF